MEALDVFGTWPLNKGAKQFNVLNDFQILAISFKNRRVGWAVTRSSLEWEVRGSNQTQCCQRLAIAATF